MICLVLGSTWRRCSQGQARAELKRCANASSLVYQFVPALPGSAEGWDDSSASLHSAMHQLQKLWCPLDGEQAAQGWRGGWEDIAIKAPRPGGLGRGLMSPRGSCCPRSSAAVKSGMDDAEPSTRTMGGLCTLGCEGPEVRGVSWGGRSLGDGCCLRAVQALQKQAVRAQLRGAWCACSRLWGALPGDGCPVHHARAWKACWQVPQQPAHPGARGGAACVSGEGWGSGAGHVPGACALLGKQGRRHSTGSGLTEGCKPSFRGSAACAAAWCAVGSQASSTGSGSLTGSQEGSWRGPASPGRPGRSWPGDSLRQAC